MKIKKIKPMYTRIVTTMDMYLEDAKIGGTDLIDVKKLKQGIKEYQKVLAVGTAVKTVKEGDLVCINPDRYAVRKYDTKSNSLKQDILENQITSYNFNVINLDGKDCLLLDETDIEFIITDFDPEEND